jgi:hypothetical protein
MQLSPDLFGAPIAEHDHSMLDRAFSRTEEYRLLLAPTHRYVVVGRRGTGKSALFYELAKKFGTDKGTLLVTLEADEASLTAIRSYCESVASEYKQLRRIARMIWLKGILSEIALQLKSNYKFKKLPEDSTLRRTSEVWESLGKTSFLQRILAFLKSNFKGLPEDSKKAFIELEERLNCNELIESLRSFAKKFEFNVVFLADKLDEGWDDTAENTGFIAGFIVACNSLLEAADSIRVVAFMRDNIFRSIRQRDTEGAKLLENCHVRLHWDEERLFQLVCDRIKSILNSPETSLHKIWNLIADRGIENRKGFVQCLGHTLYRPRDIIELLNRACLQAASKKQDKLIIDDIEYAASNISESKLSDLQQEYGGIFPALRVLIAGFRSCKGVLTKEELEQRLALITGEGASAVEQQDLSILPDAKSRAVLLYNVGFIGAKKKDESKFVFCHDGSLNRWEFSEPGIQFMIHPCYWQALKCAKESDAEWARAAMLVHDEYGASAEKDPYYRTKKVDGLLNRLGKIAEGHEGATEFEEWNFETIDFLMRGRVSYLELHPNKLNASRRDIVGTITTTEGFWSRINKDFDVRQIIFEVKNYAKLKAEDYQQISSYLKDHYGRFLVIVCRRESDTPDENDVRHLRELWHEKKTFIILPHTALSKCLAKAKSPDKYEYTDGRLQTLVNLYARVYMHS